MFQSAFANKRVVVTGHTGFKGSWLTFWLLREAAEVLGIALDPQTSPALHTVLDNSKHIEDRRVNICDLDALLEVFETFKPEYVFHLAAQALVHSAYQQPVDTLRTNVLGTANVLEAIRKTPSVRAAVIITSDKCYENVEWEYGYREDDRLGGIDPYSASKACAEVVFHSYSRSYFIQPDQARIATGRAGNVIGGGDWSTYRIVPDIAKAWSLDKKVIIRNPEATRPWQHVLEPLSGYMWLAAQLYQNESGLHGESFNFGPAGESNFTVREVISEMAKTWPGPGYDVMKGEKPNKEAGLLKLCCDKALQRLKWRPTLNFEETLRITADWYRAFYENKGDMAQVTKDQVDFYLGLAKERGQQWTLSQK